MNKELEALQEVREQLIYYKEYAKDVLPTKAKQIDDECEEELNIIETALKRIPDLEKALDSEIDYGAMMNKQGLELKKKLEHSQEQRELYFKQSKELKANLNKACKQLNEYGRKLKALEIIKEKFYFEWLLCSKNVEQYNEAQDSDKNKLTQEEYELLKEVIIHDR